MCVAECKTHLILWVCQINQMNANVLLAPAIQLELN